MKIIDYKDFVLLVDCPECENWVELDGNQPRHQASGYGFDFEFDDTVNGGTFICQECKCEANQEYEERENDDEI